MAEARWLAGEGVRELIVVAQDPTAYGEDWGQPGAICALLDALDAVEGIRWIRILYAYPERITDDFIAAMQRNEKVVPYLDLPIQHCDDRVLAAMGRRGSRADIEDAIRRLRAAIPDLTLRTTLIAGFPARPRPNTPSCAILCAPCALTAWGALLFAGGKHPRRRDGSQLDEETKQKRADHIMELQADISAAAIGRQGRPHARMYLRRRRRRDRHVPAAHSRRLPEIDGNVLTPADTPLVPGDSTASPSPIPTPTTCTAMWKGEE